MVKPVKRLVHWLHAESFYYERQVLIITCLELHLMFNLGETIETANSMFGVRRHSNRRVSEK